MRLRAIAGMEVGGTAADDATLSGMSSDSLPNHPDPTDLLAVLRDGNRRFQRGERLDRDLEGEVIATAGGQRPPMAIVSCIDSRTAPELVFDLGIGEAFDIRLAGAIVDDAALGSLEYACGAAGAVLLLVLGHTGCGAVKAACDVANGIDVAGESLRHLPAVVEPILKAVEAETETVEDRSSGNGVFVDRVATLNVHRTMMEIRHRSMLLGDLERSGRIRIAGAMYDVASGEVGWLEPGEISKTG